MSASSDILDALRNGRIALPPLTVRTSEPDPAVRGSPGPRSSSRVVEVAGPGWTDRFIAGLLPRATPKAFRDALAQLELDARTSSLRPLLLTRYLAPERLSELEARGVSGIDLSGNGVVLVPGRLLVLRTGSPNRHPADRRIRNVYRGASSLVARVFLARPNYESVQEVRDEIARRGGRVSLSTVSKALVALEEDLAIHREGRASSLLQPVEILQRLSGDHRSPGTDARSRYRWRGGADALAGAIADASRSGSEDLVRTGAASVDRYAVMPRERTLQCYCTAREPIVERLKGQLEESDRFPDLELIETTDPTVYFDRRGNNGVAWSSPVQCWLELSAGDKRQSDAATTVRERILQELQAAGWTSPHE